MPTTVSPGAYPFVVVPRLTQIVLAFRQPGLIADQVCPRVPVPAELFRYTQVNEKELLQIPDTKIGRTGAANQVEFGSSQREASTQDHGLEAPVPVKDVETAAAAGVANPLDVAAVQTVELMDLARERRVATLVQTAANYAAGLRLTLDGTAGKYRFDDETHGTPVAQMQDAANLMMVRPNTIVINRPSWTALRRHPETVAKVLGPLATKGQVSLQQFAEMMEVDQVLVGDGWADTAKKGQAQAAARVWGNHVALLHINRNLTSAVTALPSFCFTASLNNRQVGQYFDPRRGVKGSQVLKVVDQLLELISYQSAGYLFSDVLTPA